MLAIVFALEKFRTYIIGSPVVIFTDHAALKYLFTKKDAKPRLIRWVLLMQEFNITIQDTKGVDNVVADHLSRIAVTKSDFIVPISESFHDDPPHCQFLGNRENTSTLEYSGSKKVQIRGKVFFL